MSALSEYRQRIELAILEIVAEQAKRRDLEPREAGELVRTLRRAMFDDYAPGENDIDEDAPGEGPTAKAEPVGGDLSRMRPAPVVLDTEQQPAEEAEPPLAARPTRIPAVPVDQSLGYDKNVCLECGGRFKLMTRHLWEAHDYPREATEAEYKRRFGLPDDYPMISGSVLEQRRGQASSGKLGKAGRQGQKAMRDAGFAYDAGLDHDSKGKNSVWSKSIGEGRIAIVRAAKGDDLMLADAFAVSVIDPDGNALGTATLDSGQAVLAWLDRPGNYPEAGQGAEAKPQRTRRRKATAG